MSQYMFLMDYDMERSLTGFVSDAKRDDLRAIIKAEVDRVADLTPDFPCKCRLTFRPKVTWLPCIGLHIRNEVKIEGEAERAFKALEDSRKHKVWPHMKSLLGSWFKPTRIVST